MSEAGDDLEALAVIKKRLRKHALDGTGYDHAAVYALLVIAEAMVLDMQLKTAPLVHGPAEPISIDLPEIK